MGYELWTSPITGYRRRGTRLSEIRALLATGVQASAILEPLQCCSANAPETEMRNIMEHRGFDVAGVQEAQNGPVIGYVEKSQFQDGITSNRLLQLKSENIISEATPLGQVFSYLRSKEWVFVVVGIGVKGIVTRADLNKPPARIYLFSLVSLLEMHLRYWVRVTYEHESWQAELSDKRLEAAKKLQVERRARNNEISLLACLQLADLIGLVVRRNELREKLQLPGKEKAKSFLAHAEGLRNNLAHSQEDLIEGSSWEDLIDLVAALESLVARSDQIIEERASALGDNALSLWVVGTE
jgi:hypothetical protein